MTRRPRRAGSRSLRRSPGSRFTIAIGAPASRRTVGVVASRRDPRRLRRLAAWRSWIAARARSPDERVERLDRLALALGRPASDADVSILVDPLSVHDAARRHGRRLPDPRLLGRVHARRPRGAALLRVPEPLRLLDARCWCWRATSCILLVGWGMVGLSSYLLIGFWWERPIGGRGRQEGVHHERDRRRRASRSALFVIWDHVHSLDYLTVFGPAGGAGIPIGSQTANWIALLLLRRRRGEVGPAAAADLAPRRDGGPDPGLRPDPRRHDGDGRRLPGRALWPLYDAGARRLRPGRPDRRRDAHHGRPDRPRADRHQAGDRVLDDVADRLHVLRRRHRRVLGGHLPPAHARVLQGAAVPRRRRR